MHPSPRIDPMITKYAIEKTLLFDGFEEAAWSGSFEWNSRLHISGSVQLADFVNNSSENLKALIDPADYETILKTGNFTVDDFFHLPQGSEGLGLFFCKRDNIILVFAFGETQPMRYKLYLEGVWMMA